MERNRTIPFLLAIILATASCTYDEIKPEKIDVPDVVSFSVNVIPIFNASCNQAGCHSVGGQSPNLTSANAYNSLTFYGYIDTTSPEVSVLYEKISIGSMKESATDQDRAIILEWIKQGAEDN